MVNSTIGFISMIRIASSDTTRCANRCATSSATPSDNINNFSSSGIIISRFLWSSYWSIIWCCIVTIMIRMVSSDNNRCSTSSATPTDDCNNFSISGFIISWFFVAIIEHFVVVAKINKRNLSKTQHSRSATVFILLPLGWLDWSWSY